MDPYERFEEWFKTKYPYPVSLVVTPEQRTHLRDAFIAGELESRRHLNEMIDKLLEVLPEGDK